MKNLRTLVCAVAVMALLPSLAQATHIVSLAPTADCEGWEVDVRVFWRAESTEGDLEFEIQLRDADGTVLEDVTWSGPITRELNDPNYMAYTFAGQWEGFYQDPGYVAAGVFYLAAPWVGGVDETTVEFEIEADCSVGTDATSWSTVKSLYH